jgi:hypothetical protein
VVAWHPSVFTSTILSIVIHLRLVDKSVYAKTLQELDCQLSAMDWIKSPFEVPMPTHSDASPEEPLGVLGRTRVEVDSRMKESDATGPVLKAGPMAAFTEAIAVMAKAEMVCLVKGILEVFNG